MNISAFFKKNWIHFAILASFLISMFAYFNVQFDGHVLKQHDVEQFKGMSNEIWYHREVTGEEPLWTNSMFGGMPAAQISVIYQGNIFKQIISGFMQLFPAPAGIFLLHLLGFYILGLCLRLKPLIAAFGAFAFAFASYEIVILQAGHNSKAMAVAFIPAVLGAFIMAFRNNWKWGAALSSLFMTFELAMNHLQVTYYLGFVLFFVGIFFLVEAIQEKKLKRFGIISAALIGGYLVAMLVNFGNISLTNSYAKHTIRGGNDLTIDANGEKLIKGTSGLDKDYITNWSYGIDESFTLLSPYVKGSHSAQISNTAFSDAVNNSDRSRAEKKEILEAPFPLYFGNQPFTSGPVYIGVLVMLLSLLGLFLLNDKIKWYLLAVSVLALMLSWGKNFMPLTDFFIDHFPGYNKFRTVTIILVLLELCLPVIGVLLLQKLWEEREAIKEKKKMFLVGSGVFLVVLLGLKIIGLGDGYASIEEQERMEKDNLIAVQTESIYAMAEKQLAEYGIDKNNKQQMDAVINQQVEVASDQFEATREVRAEIFSSSTSRSLIIGVLGIGLIALLLYTNVNITLVIVGLIVLQLIDLVPVDRNYLSDKKDSRGDYVNWVKSAKMLYPLAPTTMDQQIMSLELAQNPELQRVIDEGEERGKAKAKDLSYRGGDKSRVIDSYKFQALNMATNYRVMEFDGFWSNSRASYYHKSIGGYHGAKLRNVQNLFDFHISRSNNAVLNMLNIKYIIQGSNVNQNTGALGNAWFVRNVETVNNANEEIVALGKKILATNIGSGKLILGDSISNSFQVSDGQRLKYLALSGDTIEVPLHSGVDHGREGYFVRDVNGKTGYLPKSTIQQDSTSFEKLILMEKLYDFDPRLIAVMQDALVKKLSAQKFTGDGSIVMNSYAPNKISYSSNSSDKQLAVFSEIYYPEGWIAKIDGEEVDILKVNYALRGLEIPAGKHEIVFEFDLPAYHTAGTIAYIGSFLIILLLGFLGYTETKKTKES